MGFAIGIACISVDDAGRARQKGQAFRAPGFAPVDLDPAFAIVPEENILRSQILYLLESLAGKTGKEEDIPHMVQAIQ
jgi:hypothetical protein